MSFTELFDQLEWRNGESVPLYNGKMLNQPNITSQPVMHNVIDRLSNNAGGDAGNLFQVDEYAISNGGLYFLIEVYDDRVEKLLDGIFTFYEHIGFGGDASIGKAAFEFTVDDFPTSVLLDNANCCINLSLYMPNQNELKHFKQNSKFTWYKMEMRKGRVGGRLFITDNVWKKTVNVFTEGSCFPKINNTEVYGQFPMVKEDVPKFNSSTESFNVHYNGYAFMIDFRLNEV